MGVGVSESFPTGGGIFDLCWVVIVGFRVILRANIHLHHVIRYTIFSGLLLAGGGIEYVLGRYRWALVVVWRVLKLLEQTSGCLNHVLLTFPLLISCFVIHSSSRWSAGLNLH